MNNGCGRDMCICTHDQGCDFGWIANGDGSVRPCGNCRPCAMPLLGEPRKRWLARLRGEKEAS